jgi:hypothetical protein
MVFYLNFRFVIENNSSVRGIEHDRLASGDGALGLVSRLKHTTRLKCAAHRPAQFLVFLIQLPACVVHTITATAARTLKKRDNVMFVVVSLKMTASSRMATRIEHDLAPSGTMAPYGRNRLSTPQDCSSAAPVCPAQFLVFLM